MHILTFYDFPRSIWRSIYSTDLIEYFNKKEKNTEGAKSNFQTNIL